MAAGPSAAETETGALTQPKEKAIADSNKEDDDAKLSQAEAETRRES